MSANNLANNAISNRIGAIKNGDDSHSIPRRSNTLTAVKTRVGKQSGKQCLDRTDQNRSCLRMVYAKKAGRKAAHYELPDGTQIKGLSRNKRTLRWRIIATGETFREPDIGKAIERFELATGVKSKFAGEPMVYLGTDGDDGKAAARSPKRRFHEFADSKQIWAYVANEIRTRPKWVAEQTGIEQIGYLHSLEKPMPVPTFEEIRKAWRDNATCSKDQIQKVIRAFDDLVAVTKIGSIRDLSVTVGTAYKDSIRKRNISAKQEGHLYGGIRTLLRFIRDRGVAVADFNRALESLVMLKKKKALVTLDPKPLTRDDWDKLYATATGDDRAMILLMLNAALYVKEASRLEWSDIKDGCLVTRREKTGKCLRVAPLWKETTEAIAAVKKRDGNDRIFFNYAGAPIAISGAQRRFNELAKRANVPDVTGSQLRDGAATAAAEANVNSDLAKIHLGHASGLKDNYVLRSPKMVKPATDAVYDKYMK